MALFAEVTENEIEWHLRDRPIHSVRDSLRERSGWWRIIVSSRVDGELVYCSKPKRVLVKFRKYTMPVSDIECNRTQGSILRSPISNTMLENTQTW